MISYLFQISTYIIIGYLLILSISKPEKAAFLYFATIPTRLYNFQNFPRILSPLTFDLIIVIVLFVQFLPYINIKDSIKSTKIFILWCFLHIVFRMVHLLSYPDMSFVQVTSDMIGFYIKIYLIYLLIIGYCNRTFNFLYINKALIICLGIFFGFIFIEYFFNINYHNLYNTVFGNSELIVSQNISERGMLRLLAGPLGHWVSTGTFLVSAFSVLIYNNKVNGGMKSIFLILLLMICIFMVGARSAMVAIVITGTVYFILDYNKNQKFLSIIVLSFIFGIFLLSPYSDFLYKSFDFSDNEGLNFYRRLIIQIIMFNNIVNVPFIGYGFIGRSKTDLFQFQELMEVNLFFTEVYDFGIIIAFLTIIFFTLVLLTSFSLKDSMKNIVFYSWFGIFVCFISNGNQEFIYYLIPVIFYSYSTWYKKNRNLLPQIY